MYGYRCEYCNGIVQSKILKQEVFKHRTGFVILENVPVGVCQQCGYRYYHAKLLHQVEQVAMHRNQPERAILVPVAIFA